jgi:hypothetical protein
VCVWLLDCAWHGIPLSGLNEMNQLLF